MVTITALAPELREATVPARIVPAKMVPKKTGPRKNSVRFLRAQHSLGRFYF
jgi:hypothetical protein